MKRILIALSFVLLFHYRHSVIHFFCHSYEHNTKKKSETPRFLLINVLDKEYFEDAHITGSINVPFEEIEYFLSQNSENKEIPLIFYCANYKCQSSDEAAKTAIKKGFKDVSVYQGGTAEWYQTAQKDKTLAYTGKAESSYLKMVIFPKKEMTSLKDEQIEEHESFCELVKIISINDLQKILKQGTIEE